MGDSRMMVQVYNDGKREVVQRSDERNTGSPDPPGDGMTHPSRYKTPVSDTKYVQGCSMPNR
jgi:hypothetical protein